MLPLPPFVVDNLRLKAKPVFQERQIDVFSGVLDVRQHHFIHQGEVKTAFGVVIDHKQP